MPFLINVRLDPALVRSCIDSARLAYWATFSGMGTIQETEPLHGTATVFRWPLSDSDIRAGLSRMAKDSPKSFARFVDGTADADAGDILVQYVLLGAVVYG